MISLVHASALMQQRLIRADTGVPQLYDEFRQQRECARETVRDNINVSLCAKLWDRFAVVIVCARGGVDGANVYPSACTNAY